MELFDPIKNVENASAILDRGEWPNFHDAIVYSLNFWRGDMRPDDDIWIAPTIDASFELDALQEPYVVDIRFHSCDQIRMAHFDHNNDIYALSFAFVARGFFTDGITPLPPYISVIFEQGSDQDPSLTFKCFRVEVIGRRDVSSPPCR